MQAKATTALTESNDKTKMKSSVKVLRIERLPRGRGLSVLEPLELFYWCEMFVSALGRVICVWGMGCCALAQDGMLSQLLVTMCSLTIFYNAGK